MSNEVWGDLSVIDCANGDQYECVSKLENIDISAAFIYKGILVFLLYDHF
jgi:hypothetical protein